MLKEEIIDRFRAARRLPYKDRRRAIDALINAMAKDGHFDSPNQREWSRCIEASLICGNGEDQVKVKPWFTSVVLQTPLRIREGLVAKLIGCDKGVTSLDVFRAILDPHSYGVIATDTKTGFTFGWHKDFNHEGCETQIRELLAETITDTVTETPKVAKGHTSFSLYDKLVDLHDRIVFAVASDRGDTDPDYRKELSNRVVAFIRYNIGVIGSKHSYDEALLKAFEGGVVTRGYHWSVFDCDYGPLEDTWKDAAVFAIKTLKAHSIYTITKKDLTMTSHSPATFDSAAIAKVVEPMLPMLTDGKVTSVDQIFSIIDLCERRYDHIKTLTDELNAAKSASASVTHTKPLLIGEIARGDATVGMPDGSLGIAKACDVFGLTGKFKSRFNFDIPMFTWSAKHPLVPEIDESYIFEKRNLALVLDALNAGDNAWIYGHTGSGKTTFVEQIAARLGWPLMRINGDSDISRFELIGKTDFKDGETVFTPGALVTALEEGCILLCDEFDVTRSETAYVLNRILEMKGLLLLEDGGRFVPPHPMFRVVAACNSRGNGDEFGIYPAVRTQSAATRSRFTVWVEHDYLKADQEKALLKAKTNIADEMADKWVRLANEVRDAFKKGRVLEVISPRELLAACTRYQRLTARIGDEAEAIKMSLEAAVLARCSSSDRAVVAEIVQRVFNVA